MTELNQIFIEGYTPISSAIDITNKKLHDIRTGVIKPIYTSSRKETDKIGGFFPSDQIVIAARTGMGKTAFVLNYIQDFVNWSINPLYKGKVIILYDSWEMPEWRGVLRFYSRNHELTVKDLLNSPTEEAYQRILLLSQSLRNHPIFFRNVSQTPKDWFQSKKTIRKKYPNHTIINVVDHTRLAQTGNEKTEEQLISSLMQKGMLLKIEDDMINIFLSQMNRNIENAARSRDDIGRNLPVSSDIFGADAVFQCADVVIALHRPGFYKLENWEGIPTGIIKSQPASQDHLMIECVLKQRDGWTGVITRRHNLALNKIEDYS